MRPLVRVLVPWRRRVAASALVLASLGAQADDDIDPYTRGDAKALERAGYVQFGPFPWAANHDTEMVDRVVGAKLHWVETAHFKLGVRLPPLKVKDQRLRLKLRGELSELAARLPRVRPTARALDPWLRTHLIAHRAEAIFADFAKRLATTASDPALGPHLGPVKKYTVLVVEQAATVGRYSNQFVGRIWRSPTRHSFGREDALLYAVSTEMLDAFALDDTALHCRLAYNIAVNLIDGYRRFNHVTPAWWRCGVGLWYARRIDPRFNPVELRPDGTSDARSAWDWPPKVRALLVHDAVTPAAEMFTWKDFRHFAFRDYMVAWSRVDYLMSRGDVGFLIFMDRLKRPIVDHGLPRWEQTLEVQARAIRSAWNTDAAGLDEAWREWVRQTYPKE